MERIELASVESLNDEPSDAMILSQPAHLAFLVLPSPLLTPSHGD
jgi:hypothetical protein